MLGNLHDPIQIGYSLKAMILTVNEHKDAPEKDWDMVLQEAFN